jgi:hypothetical protein
MMIFVKTTMVNEQLIVHMIRENEKARMVARVWVIWSSAASFTK